MEILAGFLCFALDSDEDEDEDDDDDNGPLRPDCGRPFLAPDDDSDEDAPHVRSQAPAAHSPTGASASELWRCVCSWFRSRFGARRAVSDARPVCASSGHLVQYSIYAR